MLQVLSWNAYNNKPPSPAPVSNIPNPMIATAVTAAKAMPSAFARNNKRKRESDSNGEGQCPDWSSMSTSAQVAPTVNAKVPALVPTTSVPISKPTVQPNYQSSDGLPTPLLSPKATDMDDKHREVADIKPVDQDSKPKRLNKIQKVVVQQVNLEILTKHNELRLIDQEIAKCQIALEQLRRCSEIPFPGNQVSQNVSQGAGPALRQKYAGARLPTSPAPWGVLDGPYARHYATWLMPDPRWDGGDPVGYGPSNTANGKRPAKGRHGRPSIVEDISLGGMTSRSQPTPALQALPSGYAPPKEKSSGPLLLKRKSDGAMVKLKCPDCDRSNFGSAQGFINHCRIGHSRTFASHDAAAEACGERVEYDASGAMLGVEPVVTPSTTTTTTAHPLARTAHLLPKDPAPALQLALAMDGATDGQLASATGGNTTNYLEAFLQNRNIPDVEKEISNAKEKVVLPDDDVEMSDVDEISQDEVSSQGRAQTGGRRQVTGSTKAPTASPVLTSRVPVSQSEVTNEFGSPMELSHTSDSNQAPSLIDDDEEYEAQSPESSTPASELAEDEAMQFHVRDDDEPGQDDLAARTDLENPCSRPDQHVNAPGGRPSLRKEVDSHQEKHTSFNGPGVFAAQVNADRSKRRKVISK